MRIALLIVCFAFHALAGYTQQRDTLSVQLQPQLPAKTVNQLRAERGMINIQNEFVPAGQWIFGGTGSYSTHSNRDYNFLVIEDITSSGYNVSASALIGYALRKNMALGARFVYSRSMLKVNGGSISIGQGESATNIKVDYYYALRHSYSMALIWRQYIPLGTNKRFALFNEMQLAGGGVQAKFAADSPVKGTFAEGYTLSLGVNPGLIAFISDWVAAEVNVGVIGIGYSHLRQVHNQVTVGNLKASSMNFTVNLLSIGLGLSFYM